MDSLSQRFHLCTHGLSRHSHVHTHVHDTSVHTLTPFLQFIRSITLDFLQSWAPARIERPRLPEAKLLYKALVAALGPPPPGVVFPTPPILFGDGTLTPLMEPDNFLDQKLAGGKKGVGMNNFIEGSYSGLFTDFALGGYGTSSDVLVSRELFARFNSVQYNPDKISMITDCGMLPYCNSGADGRPGVYRAATRHEKVLMSDMSTAVALSKRISIWRQPNEWCNKTLKFSWPLSMRCAPWTERHLACIDIEICLRLSNARTRIVGYNQCKTTFKKFTDANVKEQLLAAHDFASYMAMRKAHCEHLSASGGEMAYE